MTCHTNNTWTAKDAQKKEVPARLVLTGSLRLNILPLIGALF